MGYYTDYTLNLYGSEEDKKKFADDLRDKYRYKDGTPDKEIENLLTFGSLYGKYYDLEDVISRITEKYPELLVVLTGDGEDSCDIWEMRCKGDLCESHSVEMPPFTAKGLEIPN